jgi:hypothetical protein
LWMFKTKQRVDCIWEQSCSSALLTVKYQG